MIFYDFGEVYFRIKGIGIEGDKVWWGFDFEFWCIMR